MAKDTQRELNRLYWESDESVAEIARRLEISRRALYERIEPRPAGVPCPECGAPLGFRNRTTAESNVAECAACGHEAELDARERMVGPAFEQERSAAPLSPTRRVPDSGGGPALALMLLAGIVLGALLIYPLRRG